MDRVPATKESQGERLFYLKSEQRNRFPVKSDEKKKEEKKKRCGLTLSHEVIYSGSCAVGELQRPARRICGWLVLSDSGADTCCSRFAAVVSSPLGSYVMVSVWSQTSLHCSGGTASCWGTPVNTP